MYPPKEEELNTYPVEDQAFPSTGEMGEEELPLPEEDEIPEEESEWTTADEKIKDLELKADIKAICDEVDTADRGLREWRNRIYKKLSFYWDGYQILYWDDQLNNYAPVSQAGYLLEKNDDIDLDDYAKVVNIYKAFGQSIIAALTVQPPKVKYIPSDADISSDNDTAKAYQLIQKKKIEKFNDPEQLVTRFCKIRYNQGLVFGYIYAVEDRKLGYYKQDVTQPGTKQIPVAICPSCGQPQPALSPQIQCPCGYAGEAMMDIINQPTQEVIDTNLIPKHKVCIDLYGPTHVSIPLFVTSLKQVPVLTLTTEMHYADVMEQFKLSEKPNTGDNPNDQRWIRMPNRYIADAEDVVTVRQRWLRPWAFNTLPEEKRDAYKAEYPEGCYVVFIDDILVAINKESMDDHWIASVDPLEDHLQGIPTGQDTVDIQDMTNEMFNITLDTIEHNVPETFVRPETLDLDQYKTQRARPGNITHAKPRAGQTLAGDFFETSQSSLSQEHTNFANKLFETGQFVSGAMPTIYGGALKGGSNTAKEYESSRSMSLQRLTPHWNVIKRFYANCMELAVPKYAELMMEDEKIVEESGGSYINVVIEKAKLDGSVGEITFDVNENIPTSWLEQRDIIMSMMPTAAPGSLLDRIFSDPENVDVVASHLGINDITIPGEVDRQKQLAEIQEMIKAEPMPNPQVQQMEQQIQGGNLQLADGLVKGKIQPPAPMVSSIQVDQLLDNHAIEAMTCSSWLKSSVGRWYKQNLPMAWQNVYLHFVEHNTLAQQQAQMEAEQQEGQEEEDNAST